ncbi:hypothetical protein FACS1894152_2200 [Bacilli bacterium]|nr:hypothetical protein FACS1894152_2200 [Bacilli bacterium]
MIIPIILTLIGFIFPHRWGERKVDSFGGSVVGSSRHGRHQQGFYDNGQNQGFFPNGVHSDNPNGYKMTGSHRRDDIMSTATHGLDKDMGNYHVIGNNCKTYKKEANRRYDAIDYNMGQGYANGRG